MDSDSKATRLVLIRHGEAQVVHDQIVGGHEGCSGLSALGRRQAEALRDRLTRTGELADATALYTSVLPRAIETAEIIAPAVGGLDIVSDCAVCEIHPGEADGLTWEEMRDKGWGTVEQGPKTQHMPWAPGSETWAEFVARVGRMLWDIARRHDGETVVLACHGGIVQVSFTILGNVPMWRDFEMPTENTSITEWTHRGDGTRSWALVRYNDAAHLAELAN